MVNITIHRRTNKTRQTWQKNFKIKDKNMRYLSISGFFPDEKQDDSLQFELDIDGIELNEKQKKKKKKKKKKLLN